MRYLTDWLVSLEKISGAFGGAIVMGGGPMLMYASHAIDAVAELSAAAEL